MTRDPIEIVYDGDCPVCAAWMRMARLRDVAGAVDLVDARSGDPRVAALMRQGYDLDRGMIVRWQGRVYHGAQAMTLLTMLSDARGPIVWIQRGIFKRPSLARRIYPVLVRGRLALLHMLGRGQIADLENNPGDGNRPDPHP